MVRRQTVGASIRHGHVDVESASVITGLITMRLVDGEFHSISFHTVEHGGMMREVAWGGGPSWPTESAGVEGNSVSKL